MAFDSNAFCWNGVVTTDRDAAAAFYASTIGWTTRQQEFPNGDVATMFVAGGVPRAHLRPPGHEREPCAWTSYLRVDDVDASTEDGSSNGGTVLMPPTDIPPGRMSILASPGGHVLCLFHERDEAEAASAPAGPGNRHWTELHSRDAAADVAWLRSTFGFEVEEMPIPDGGTYHVLHAGGRPRGGVCEAFRDDVTGWLNWIEVPDVDGAVARAVAAGGEKLTDPSDWPDVGRMAMLRDPTGAAFGVIAPAG